MTARHDILGHLGEIMDSGTGRPLSHGERDWLAVRRHVQEHRYDLAVSAARLYPHDRHVAGTPLLSTVDWIPGGPVPLDAIALHYTDDPPPPAVTGHDPAALDDLPVRPDGTPYQRYSQAIAELAPPAVFEDRPTYRLLGANLTGTSPRMDFGPGSYFDGTDVGDTCAHEYAAAALGKAITQSLRAALDDPCDPARRPVNLAISALTLRHDRAAGTATFPLHARGAGVGHAAGMYQVLPVGVFQPAGTKPWNTTNDFDLWRCLIREYAEELLGGGEDHGADTAPIDYDAWPLAAAMTTALREGRIRAHCLGLGVDPLTLATDLLAVVTISAGSYDELFAHAVPANTEGTITAAVPFTADTVERYAGREPTQAAGAALLRLAWQHRATLLG
jgi:hypothetical protein